MKIHIRLFAAYREKVDQAEISLDLPEGADVAELKTALANQAPALADVLSHALVAVNEEFAASDTRLNEGDIAAFFPPVSGG